MKTPDNRQIRVLKCWVGSQAEAICPSPPLLRLLNCTAPKMIPCISLSLYVNTLDAERTQFGASQHQVFGAATGPWTPAESLLLWRKTSELLRAAASCLGAERALAAVRLDSDTNKPWAAASGGSAGTETASSLWDVAPREASGDRPFKLTLTVTPAGGLLSKKKNPA